MKKKTVFKIVGGVIVTIAIAIGVGWGYGKLEETEAKLVEEKNAPKVEEEEVKVFTPETEVNSEIVPHEPTIEEIANAKEELELYDIDREGLENVIHKMTHQKVRAEQKWGLIEMTPANIYAVYEVASEKGYAELTSYLEDWKVGNFQNAVEVHNYIWQKQDGTVGKATGLLSKSEELVPRN